jgi:hypothetical protein
MPTLNISMFNSDDLKLTLFYALIQRSKATTQFITQEINLFQTKQVLDMIKKGYIDRYNGQVFKSDISGDTFDTGLYDRDNGTGAAERIVNFIKSELKL